MKAARETGSLMPPAHIRNAPTKLMKDLGYGKGYAYDPDTPEGFSGQNYFPDGMERRVFYKPKGEGHEARVKERLERWAAMRAGRKRSKTSESQSGHRRSRGHRARHGLLSASRVGADRLGGPLRPVPLSGGRDVFGARGRYRPAGRNARLFRVRGSGCPGRCAEGRGMSCSTAIPPTSAGCGARLDCATRTAIGCVCISRARTG